MPSTNTTLIYPHPVLHITTIPYDFHTSSSGSTLSSLSLTSKPRRRAVARFFTSLCVAFGILFLWLIFAHCIRALIFGHDHLYLGPPHPHHGGFRSQEGVRWERTAPVVVKPTIGISKPRFAHSTRFSSTSPTIVVAATSSGAVTPGMRRVVITADR